MALAARNSAAGESVTDGAGYAVWRETAQCGGGVNFPAAASAAPSRQQATKTPDWRKMSSGSADVHAWTGFCRRP
jgi:hypothetical protein